jgi:hypothetical protein
MANTLGGINLAQIAQQTLDYLATTFVPLKAFHRDFSRDIQQKGASVATRVPSSVTAGDLSAGYTQTDVTSTAITITLSNFKGFVYGFTDLEISKAGDASWLQQIFMAPAVESMLAAFMGDALPLVTAANFAGSSVKTAAQFDADAAADIAGTLSTNKVMLGERALLIKPTYYANLQKDNAIQVAFAYGGSEAIRGGTVPVIHGLTPYPFNGTIPDNGEALEGFASHPSALCMAARQIATPQNFTGQIENIEEPQTGLPIQLRTWYDHNLGITKLSIGSLYGISKGNGAALIRITSA